MLGHAVTDFSASHPLLHLMLFWPVRLPITNIGQWGIPFISHGVSQSTQGFVANGELWNTVNMCGGTLKWLLYSSRAGLVEMVNGLLPICFEACCFTYHIILGLKSPPVTADSIFLSVHWTGSKDRIPHSSTRKHTIRETWRQNANYLAVMLVLLQCFEPPSWNNYAKKHFWFYWSAYFFFLVGDRESSEASVLAVQPVS